MSTLSNFRIIFFIGSLRSGGKERRLIELLTYLKKECTYDLMLVVTRDEVHYSQFYNLNINYHVINAAPKNKLRIWYDFYKICKEFKPHLVHAWGRMQCFYSLPSVIGQKIPLINSQITAAPPNLNKFSFLTLVDRINFHLSTVILSNSKAGVDVYNPPAKKTKVIYNGINLNRFENLPDIEWVKKKYGIDTPYIIIKIASFTPNKDYNLFINIASKITAVRNDITFIGVGGYDKDDSAFNQILAISKGNNLIQFPGKINDVEALINASTIGLLFTNKTVHGEGISNAILEYMALAKPVIANDAGGTNEIVHHNENGYLITKHTEDEIANLIIQLVDDPGKCRSFGKAGRLKIIESFSLNKMGLAFSQVYKDVLNIESTPTVPTHLSVSWKN
jgi:glycosyltransferase involved in cell wall biosynthesis